MITFALKRFVSSLVINVFFFCQVECSVSCQMQLILLTRQFKCINLYQPPSTAREFYVQQPVQPIHPQFEFWAGSPTHFIISFCSSAEHIYMFLKTTYTIITYWEAVLSSLRQTTPKANDQLEPSPTSPAPLYLSLRTLSYNNSYFANCIL